MTDTYQRHDPNSVGNILLHTASSLGDDDTVTSRVNRRRNHRRRNLLLAETENTVLPSVVSSTSSTNNITSRFLGELPENRSSNRYRIPSFQNPSSTTASNRRRTTLLETKRDVRDMLTDSDWDDDSDENSNSNEEKKGGDVIADERANNRRLRMVRGTK